MNQPTTKAQRKIVALLASNRRARLYLTTAMAGERAELVVGAHRIRVSKAAVKALHKQGFTVLYEEIVTEVYVLPTHKEGR